MGWTVSTRRVAILLVSLALSVSLGCYKRYVRAHVPRCDPMNEELLVYLGLADNVCVDYTADLTIPYCAGIDGLLDD